MPKFDRYMLSQLLVLFGFFALVLVSVYWVNRAVILFDQLIADGQSAAVFLEFTALSLPNVIRLVLPMAAFIAAVYTTNRMASESELVIVQATGFSPFRMARAVVVFGLFVALLMSVLVHLLVPSARGQLADREIEIQNNLTARFLREGQFVHPVEGITFYIREISPERELLNVFLSDSRDTNSRTTYIAKRAYLVRQDTGPKLIMFDGSTQVLSLDDKMLSNTRFEDFTYNLGDLVGESTRTGRDVREYPTPVLFYPTPEALAATNQPVARFTYEAHLRIVQPFTALVAALIGFSTLMLGGFSRFGVWRQIVLAVVLLIVVQILENAAASEARSNESLWYLVYVPVLFGLALSWLLLWISSRPNPFRRRRQREVPA